jgi:hypothetical protein
MRKEHIICLEDLYLVEEHGRERIQSFKHQFLHFHRSTRGK